jgi:gamma-glutamyltranspeptidase/glutathione hydrolase
MYRGAWGRRLIEVVAREGGRLSLRDLARYRARWVRPVRGTYHDYVVHGPGLPGLGGVHAIEALNVLEAAGLTLDEERASSLALYWLMRITQVAYRRARTADSSRSDKARARDVWRRIRERTSSAASPSRQGHSDAVVAVDADGNVAALCHSINTIAWGTTALFVDGVSIPDSACFQQRLMRQVGAGARLPDPMNPLIVARDGRPVLATSSIGSSLHEVTIQSLVNILDRGMEPRDAVLAPQFMSPVWTTRRWKRGEAPARASAPRKRCAPKRPTRTLVPAQTVEPGNFSTRLLRGVRARGQAVYLANDNPLLGYWAGIQIDPDTGALLGAVTSRRRESAAAAHGY